MLSTNTILLAVLSLLPAATHGDCLMSAPMVSAAPQVADRSLTGKWELVYPNGSTIEVEFTSSLWSGKRYTLEGMPWVPGNRWTKSLEGVYHVNGSMEGEIIVDAHDTNKAEWLNSSNGQTTTMRRVIANDSGSDG
jgi:hypothetical protein